MKKYFEKYANQAAYEATNNKWPHVSYIEETEEVKYEEEPDYSTEYFTTVALSDGNIVFNATSKYLYNNNLSYSTDEGRTWSNYAQANTVAVSAGDRVMWKGQVDSTLKGTYGIGRFSTGTTANFNVEGNIMSLIYGDSFQGKTSLNGFDEAFTSLFLGITNVVNAKNLILPATTLANDCYLSMFQGCTSLTTAPELPATTLAQGCYWSMFKGCTSLTTAPQLPATTLASKCYQYMFNGCTSLTTAPVLLATTLADYCYSNMFYNCSNLTSITCLATNISASNCTSSWLNGVAASGTFTKAASMNDWTTGNNGIPSGWSVQNYQG